MSKMLAMAVPILPGKTAEWKNFMNELKTKWYKDFVASRKRNKVRERTFLQQTPMGDFVLVTLEGDDPQGAFAAMGAASDPFTKWFLAGVKSLHGMDLTQPPPGPMPEMVIDSGT